MGEWTDQYFGELYQELYQKHLLPEERTRTEVEFIREVLRLPGKRVLDLAAGYGRHSRLLARDNQVVALDRNQDYIIAAGQNLKGAARRNLMPVRGDMRLLPIRSGSIEAVICLFNSFGYFVRPETGSGKSSRQLWKLPGVFYDRALVPEDFGRPAVAREEVSAGSPVPETGGALDQNVALLDEFRRVLVRRGELLLEIPNPKAVLAAVAEAPRRRQITSRFEIEEEFAFDSASGVLSNRTRFRVGENQATAEYFLRLYDRSEIVAELRKRGFTVPRVCGSYQGDAFDSRQSEIILIHARRK